MVVLLFALFLIVAAANDNFLYFFLYFAFSQTEMDYLHRSASV